MGISVVDVVSMMLRPVRRRLAMIVTRCLVVLVNDARKMQTLQVSALSGELLDNIERFQQYGFTSHPHDEAEGILLSLGGSRGHSVVICIDDRRYRFKAMAKGEVALYTDENEGAPHRIHFKRGREIHLLAGDSAIVMKPDEISLTSATVNITAGAITMTRAT